CSPGCPKPRPCTTLWRICNAPGNGSATCCGACPSWDTLLQRNTKTPRRSRCVRGARQTNTPSMANTPPRWCARRWPSVTPTKCTRAVSASTPPCAGRTRRRPTWRCVEASSITTAAAAIDGPKAMPSCLPPPATMISRRRSAFISLDAQDGAVRALVGGFDFGRNKFNHVTQAWRQPGSSFKPFIYSASLEKGFTPATVIADEPVVLEAEQTGSQRWEPKNYD